MNYNRILSLRISSILIVLFLCSIISCSQNLESAQIEEGVKAPDFTLYDINGKKVTLSDFYGKNVVLLDFFASWSPSCIREIKVINSLNKQYQKKGLKILCIDSKESKEKATAIIKKYNIRYTLLLDKDGKISAKYNVRGVPYLILIDKKGTIRWVDYWMSKKAKALIEKLLKD